MTPVDFLDLVSQYQEILLAFCLIFTIGYFLIYRSGISSVADPLFLGVVASAFSTSVIAILVYFEKIDEVYLVSFLTTEVGFIAASIWGGAKNLQLRRLTPDATECSWFLVFHYLFVTTFLAASFIYLWNVGLPVLQEASRLITFQELGILTWILDVTWVGVPLSVLLKRNFLNRKSAIDYLLLIFSFFLFATKGGKSDIVYILFVLHVFSQVTGATSTKRIESILLMAIPILIFIITSIILATWGVEVSAFQVVLERFLLFGDVFFMGYNEAFLATVPDVGVFDYFFGGIKSIFNSLLGNYSSPRFILGYAISEFYYGVEEGIGPNARHNILGFILWGPIFSLAFSICCGFVFRFCRKNVLGSGRNLFYIFLYCIINIYSWMFFVDPSLAVGYILKIILVVLPLAMCSYLLRSLFIYAGFIKYCSNHDK